MKMSKVYLSALVLWMACTAASAQEALADEQLVNRLLQLQQTDQVMAKIEKSSRTDSLVSIFTLVVMAKISDLEKQRPLTKEQKAALHAAANSVQIPFDSASIRRTIVDEYRRSYTSGEMRQLIAFFETPLGQKTVAMDLALGDKLVGAYAAMQIAAVTKVAPQVEAAMDEAVKSFGTNKP